MSDDRLVAVCDSCLRASCWQGEFSCERYRTAGMKLVARSELTALAIEAEHYWDRPGSTDRWMREQMAHMRRRGAGARER